MHGHTPLPQKVNPLAPCDAAAAMQPTTPLVDVHRAISAVFGISRRRSMRDNLPYNTGRGIPRDQLGVLFRTLQYRRGAEIGVSKGEFSQVLCDANPDLELLCIDAWSAAFGGHQHQHDERYANAKRRLAGRKVTLIRKDSMAALVDVPDGSLDFVYIDAGHRFDECCPDLIYWSRKVRSGGIVAGHDYFNNFQYGVIEAVNAYTKTHHIDPWYVTLEVYPSFFWVKP